MQSLSKYLIAIGLITTINGYVATRFMKANKETYHQHYEFLANQNKECLKGYQSFINMVSKLM